MIGFKPLIVGTIMSMGVATSASAQVPTWGKSNPAAFQAQYPDRDVLDGGALTPAGRMGELPGGGGSLFLGTANRSGKSRIIRLPFGIVLIY
jgi:hypothetical protein